MIFLMSLNGILSFYLSENSEKFKYSEKFFLNEENVKSEMKCCRVEAVVTVDSKGQIVLPKDVREKIKLKPNDKLAIIICGREGENCCLIIVKAENLGGSVKSFLGPVLREVLG